MKNYEVRLWDPTQNKEVVKSFTQDEILANPMNLHIEDFYLIVGKIISDLKKRVEALEERDS